MKSIILTLLISTLAFGGSISCDCEQSTEYFDSFNKKCKAKTGNCASFELIVGNSTHPSGYSCNSCNGGFYLQVSDKSCQTITTNNCIRAYISGGVEQCQECNPNFYVSRDKTSCIAYPTDSSTNGYDENCAQYIASGSDALCDACSEGFYPQNGLCVANPTDGQGGYVEGCQKYLKYGTYPFCTKCNDDFSFGVRLGGSVCESMKDISPNCIKAKSTDVSACSACEEGYVYARSTSSCQKSPTVSSDDGYVENCKTYKFYGYSLKCEFCKVGYVNKDNVCEQVPTASLVTNCVKYGINPDDSSYQCIDCEDTYWSDGVDQYYSSCQFCPGYPKQDPAPIISPSASSIIRFGGLIFIVIYTIF